jgi:mannose-6-phosphate isomerase-like protein (cupin superfamily)
LTIFKLNKETKMEKQIDINIVFPKPQSVGERPWGTEDLLALVSKQFSLKRLRVKAGSKGGVQYHRLKDEVAILISGKMLIRYDLGNKVLQEKIIEPGDVVHFPPGLVHQEEAITDCELIEASSPHFNDRVRVEENYGFGEPVGLPSTNLDDIELR